MVKKTITKKEASVQMKMKMEVMDIVAKALEDSGYNVQDCRLVQGKIDGATKFTLFVRGDNADIKVGFTSKPDKKSPYYIQMDELLGEEKCTDE